MKYLLFLILLLPFRAFGQKNNGSPPAAFRIDSLPVKSIILNKGWTWHPGDNPDWAKPAIDDSKWEPIDPTQDIDRLPQLKKAGIGWFRLRLKVDTSLVNSVVGILVSQVIASEIYLDGQRVAGFGKVSRNPDQVEAYNPSGAPKAPSQIAYFTLGKQREQVLAVRFAVEPGITYVGNGSIVTRCFQIRMNSANRMNYGHIESLGYLDLTPIEYFKVGLYLLLALLHLTFYKGYPTQKSNLYFGLTCILLAGYFLLEQPTLHYIHWVPIRMYVNLVIGLFFYFSIFLLLVAVNQLLSYQNRRVFGGFLLLGVVTFLICWFRKELTSLTANLFVIAVHVEVARVSVWAIRQKKEGAGYILFGSLGYAVFVMLFLVFSRTIESTFIRLIAVNLAYNLGSLCLPIGITLYLAREFVQTTISLQHNLQEVKQLSAEKEQILTTQNETLELQVSERTAALNQSLTALKATQTQLIQKEKLASLGELTAGIAHEIQNPLNFVNNFSEVSTELISELKDELDRGDTEEAQAIAADLTQNLQKITHHGKRASSIVKGMLEHSRATTGERQPTDLKALADEYLRLAYQGLRAKDNTFAADYELIADENLPLVNVVPQEIGRVLLNLLNNAFYAVHQRAKSEVAYKPKVFISLKAVDNQVVVNLHDNGVGIPKEIKAKIFQPFFTTKPTGEGTGLGLSLSYDIVTKGHGGTLTVESEPGEYTEFIITLPFS